MIDTTKATFDGIRENIVNYLSKNPTFKDYNFTAPAISTLIDALAYTSHYLLRYTNFSLNECFLDSAQLRNSVVSHAKELGYVPHQYMASRAKLRLKYVSNVSSKFLASSDKKVKKGTSFTATNSETMKSYTFCTLEDTYFYKNDKGEWVADLDVYEGTFVTEKFEQSADYDSRYFLINENVDTEFMTVIVYESKNDTEGIPYKNAKLVESLGSDEALYYIYEAYNGKLEIVFGDGKLSKRVDPYSIISVRYFVTNGADANNISTFMLSDSVCDESPSAFTLELIQASESGGGREDIESIRFNAPKYFQAQNRAVTTTDYNVLLMNKFGSIIDSIVAWGGEEQTNPEYGKVFICIKPKDKTFLSLVQRNMIENYLKDKSLPCIDVEIVDPIYINVKIELDVFWNKYATSFDKSKIIDLISNATNNMFTFYSSSFKSTFKHSKYITELASLDKSIDSILARFTLKQFLIPEDIDMSLNYTFEFHNEIQKHSVLIGSWNEPTGTFTIRDDYINGELWLYKLGLDEKYYPISNVGFVDYKSGVITINKYSFYNVMGIHQIPVVCKPLMYNLSVLGRYLLKLDTQNDTNDEYNSTGIIINIKES